MSPTVSEDLRQRPRDRVKHCQARIVCDGPHCENTDMSLVLRAEPRGFCPVQALRRNKSGKVFALPQSYRVERFEAADRMDVTTEISPSEAGTILTVDLEAIVANWQTLRMVCGEAECGAVVKADAYGLGLNPVVKALYEAGCKTFFVAHPFEGRAVRAIAPNVVVNRPAAEAGLALLDAGGDFADGVIAYEGSWLGADTLIGGSAHDLKFQGFESEVRYRRSPRQNSPSFALRMEHL